MEDKIYLKLEEEPKNLKDLFTKLFNTNGYGIKYSVSTYKDPKCEIVQTAYGKRRSFEDMLILANTYFPETEIKKVFITLLSLNLKDGNQKLHIYPYPCKDIKKTSVMFHVEKNTSSNASEHWYNKQEGNWSMKDLCEMIDCHSFEEMYKYSEKITEESLEKVT